MQSRKSDSIDWETAPAENFTGRAWFGPMAVPGDTSALNVLGVGFEPGARTHWHSHPGGQVLYCVSGQGLVANEHGERTTLTTGDSVQIPSGEVHWHGASRGAPMVHLSITMAATEWTDRPVTDVEYQGDDSPSETVDG